MCNEKNSHGFLADLADQMALALRKRFAVSPDRATEMGLEVAEDVRRLWGGVSVYVCKTDTAAVDARHDEIYEAWRREGFSMDLLRRFGISEQRVRQIVAIKRRERRQKGVGQPLDMIS